MSLCDVAHLVHRHGVQCDWPVHVPELIHHTLFPRQCEWVLLDTIHQPVICVEVHVLQDRINALAHSGAYVVVVLFYDLAVLFHALVHSVLQACGVPHQCVGQCCPHVCHVVMHLGQVCVSQGVCEAVSQWHTGNLVQYRVVCAVLLPLSQQVIGTGTGMFEFFGAVDTLGETLDRCAVDVVLVQGQ